MGGGSDPPEIAGRLWRHFAARRVVLAGHSTQPFDAAVWRDALVIVEQGTIELETLSGVRRSFGVGDILWLAGLNLLALHNPRAEDTVLAAISRSPSEETGDRIGWIWC